MTIEDRLKDTLASLALMQARIEDWQKDLRRPTRYFVRTPYLCLSWRRLWVSRSLGCTVLKNRRTGSVMLLAKAWWLSMSMTLKEGRRPRHLRY